MSTLTMQVRAERVRAEEELAAALAEGDDDDGGMDFM